MLMAQLYKTDFKKYFNKKKYRNKTFWKDGL